MDDSDQFEFDFSLEQDFDLLNFDRKPQDKMNEAIKTIEDSSILKENDTEVLKLMLGQLSFKDGG